MGHSHLDPVKHPQNAACGCGEEHDLDKHIGAEPKAAQSAANSESASPVPGGHNLLFTTPTCPNCRLAVTMLDKQHFPMRS